MMNIVNKDNFEEILKENEKLIIIDCFAEWCMPCKMFAPVFEKISQDHANVIFAKLNIDENEEIVNKYSIEAVPTILFIKNGNVINQEIGVRSESEMIELIKKYDNK